MLDRAVSNVLQLKTLATVCALTRILYMGKFSLRFGLPLLAAEQVGNRLMLLCVFISICGLFRPLCTIQLAQSILPNSGAGSPYLAATETQSIQGSSQRFDSGVIWKAQNRHAGSIGSEASPYLLNDHFVQVHLRNIFKCPGPSAIARGNRRQGLQTPSELLTASYTVNVSRVVSKGERRRSKQLSSSVDLSFSNTPRRTGRLYSNQKIKFSHNLFDYCLSSVCRCHQGSDLDYGGCGAKRSSTLIVGVIRVTHHSADNSQSE